MHVEDGCVAASEDRLVGEQLEQLNLGFDDFSCRYDLVLVAKNVTLGDSGVVFDMKELQFDILTRACIPHLLVLRVVDFTDLTRVLNRRNNALVTKPNRALLDLAEDHFLACVGHLVKDWKTQRRVRISRVEWKRVYQLNEGGTLIPVADLRVDLLNDVVA